MHINPRRVAQGQVKPSLICEDVGKFQLPVEEVLTGRHLARHAQARVHAAQLVYVHLAGRVETVFQLGYAHLLVSPQVVPALVTLRIKERALAHRALGHVERCGHRPLENQAHVEQELLAARQLLGLLNRPEPQGAPIVHRKLETRVRASVALMFGKVILGVDGILLADGVVRGLRSVAPAPQLKRVARLTLHATLLLYLSGPQLVHRARKTSQALYLAFLIGARELFLPVLDASQGLGLQLLHGLVVVSAHGRIAHKEVVHAMALGTARFIPYALGLFVPPLRALGPACKVALGIAAPARSYEGVSAMQLVAKPRHETVAADGVQPQRDLSQLHGYGVEVDAVHVAVSYVHFHALQLVLALLGWDGLAKLGLAQAQVSLGQLVDGLVQEGGAAHGGLYHLEVEHLGGRLALEQLLQRVVHQAARKALGRVVACARLALATSKAVDELALLVHARKAFLRAALIAHTLVLVVLLKLVFGHEITHVELVERILGTLDLIEVFLGNEAAVREQRLIHAAQLVDAERGITDALTAMLAVGPRDAHEIHDMRHHAITQPGGAHVRGVVLLIEDVGLERRHKEHVVVSGARL